MCGQRLEFNKLAEDQSLAELITLKLDEAIYYSLNLSLIRCGWNKAGFPLLMLARLHIILQHDGSGAEDREQFQDCVHAEIPIKPE